MVCSKIAAIAATIILCASVCPAALIVNAPLPITHQVDVQLIQTAETDGSPVATAYGNATQRQAIEDKVNQIWAQAGIRINFLDDIHRVNNTQAYQSSGTLSNLMSIAYGAGALSPDLSTLNLVFTSLVPTYSSHLANSSAGVAYLPGNGIAQFVYPDLLGRNSGRETIAHVTSHEIAHNLGIGNQPFGTPNLMAYSGTAQLSSSQISQALSSPFVKQLPASMPADLNGDGKVDGQDYAEWREGVVTGQYPQVLFDEFLNSYGASSSTPNVPQVPEPSAVVLLAVCLGLGCHRRQSLAH